MMYRIVYFHITEILFVLIQVLTVQPPYFPPTVLPLLTKLELK